MYNLYEFYIFRDCCCAFLEYCETENSYCRICCKETENSIQFADTTSINGISLKNSEILSQICCYDFNVSIMHYYILNT